MSPRMTSYDTLHTNLSAAGTTIMLCRANLEQVDLSREDMMDLIWRIERQIEELKGMQGELGRMSQRIRAFQPSVKPRLRVVE
jgi:hypothetical protein